MIEESKIENPKSKIVGFRRRCWRERTGSSDNFGFWIADFGLGENT